MVTGDIILEGPPPPGSAPELCIIYTRTSSSGSVDKIVYVHATVAYLIIIIVSEIPLYRYTYKSKENQQVLSRLIDEVRGLNSQYITQHIRGM